MAISSTDNLKSLSEIFVNDIQFVIPDNQRGYSWGKKQLSDLWEDIGNLSGAKDHYTGMLTFCNSNSNKKFTLLLMVNKGLQHLSF